MMPSIKEIIISHPYLIPLLVIALIMVAIGTVFTWACRASRWRNCPGCTEGKQGPCLVACERVFRRLDDLEVRDVL